MTSTTIKIKTDDPSPAPIAGVAVEFYNSTTAAFVTSGTTDGSGAVTVLLPDGTYNVLFYKPGVSILPKQPQQIVVSSLAASNTFLVSGHVRSMPESPDALRCRVSGFLVGLDNLPAKDIHLSLVACPDVSVVGGNLVSPQTLMRVSPDSEGYFEFDLIRGMTYSGMLRYVDRFPQLNVDPAKLDIRVPNLPSLSLPNLLFPLPMRTVFSVASISIPLASGPDSTTAATTTYSDGSERLSSSPWSSLQYVYSDPTVCSVAVLGGNLVITPTAVGTTTVTLERMLPSSVFWPDAPTYLSDTIAITVT